MRNCSCFSGLSNRIFISWKKKWNGRRRKIRDNKKRQQKAESITPLAFYPFSWIHRFISTRNNFPFPCATVFWAKWKVAKNENERKWKIAKFIYELPNSNGKTFTSKSFFLLAVRPQIAKESRVICRLVNFPSFTTKSEITKLENLNVRNKKQFSLQITHR